MKIVYFDCFSGAGGDMLAGAMIDAGLDGVYLKGEITKLGLAGLEIEISQELRGGIKAVRFVPVFGEQGSHRNLKVISEIIEQSGINEKVKKTAIEIFTRLANAEAAVHGKKVEQIHFHEVGAVDAIADIVAAAVGVEELRSREVEKFYCSPLSVGGGTIKCAHGVLPVPAPATVELLKDVPVVCGPVQKELLTPTAAAILTTIVDEFREMPSMKIAAVGYGAGTIEIKEIPNVVRLIVGETSGEGADDTDCVCLLESNIDDVSGELIGCAVDKLFEGGALDVFTEPIYMKRNRLAVKISVICKVCKIGRMEEIIFGEGLTFGVRKQIMQRSKLKREIVGVETEFGPIKMKVGKSNGKIVNAKPELADCAAAAKAHNVSVKNVIEAAKTAYGK